MNTKIVPKTQSFFLLAVVALIRSYVETEIILKEECVGLCEDT